MRRTGRSQHRSTSPCVTRQKFDEIHRWPRKFRTPTRQRQRRSTSSCANSLRCAPHATEASPGSRIQKCARACAHKNESVPVFRLRYPALATAETVRETAKFVQPTSGLSIRRTLSPARSKPAAQCLRKREKFIAVVAGVSPAKVKSAADTAAVTVLEIA